MKLKDSTRLIFIGDSITDCGRGRPVGDGNLGNGFVSMVDALLVAAYPQLKIRTINQGTGGHTVRDLAGRWDADVLALKPDWLVVMIGINDVWRQFDNAIRPEYGVPLPEYEKTLDQLIAKTLPITKNIVLMTPFFIESSTHDAMRSRMDEYGAAVKKLAHKHALLCVDTQAAFNHVLESRYSAALAGDRVHPNAAGHMLLARAFLKSIDFAW